MTSEQKEMRGERLRSAGVLVSMVLFVIGSSWFLPRKVTTSRQTRERIEVLEDKQADIAENQARLLKNQEVIIDYLSGGGK